MISIDIVPVSESLVMYGEADPASAYSLSGHVSISLSSPCSMFKRRCTMRLLLQSLTLTFEGQTEILTPHTGYAAARLCAVTREIASNEPIELTDESEDSDASCTCHVLFNLPIPGWLPESSIFGTDLGIRYALFAEARFSDVEDSFGNSWSLPSLCSSFRSRVRSAMAEKPIVLRRLFSAFESSSDSSVHTFIVSTPDFIPSEDSNVRIPVEVLSKVQVLATLPVYVNVDDEELTVTVRMRTKDLCVSECRRIRIASIAADIFQCEDYRVRVLRDYPNRYFLPPHSEQPPNLPLRDPGPSSTIYNLGLCGFEDIESTSRSFSLLPPGEPKSHSLGEDNYPFKDDADEVSEPMWYTLETTVPLHRAGNRSGSNLEEWLGPPFLRPSLCSPLISVRHEISIHLMCSYDIPESGKVARERLSFTLPVRFTYTPEASVPSPLASLSANGEDTTGCVPITPSPGPYGHNLPAYSQLFDHNGDRKIDYSVPLPLYTPRSLDRIPPSNHCMVSKGPEEGRHVLLRGVEIS